MVAPMLYLPCSGQDLTGWLISEKLDGVRALWNGRCLLSRSGQEIAAPDWFTATLPAVWLDGELYMGKGTLGKMSGLARKNAPDDPDWDGVMFCVFDLPAHPGGYANRYRALLDISEALPLASAGVIRHDRCDGDDWLRGALGAVIKNGGEGLVARHPGGLYRSGERSQDVIKIKPDYPEAWRLLDDTPRSGER